MFGSLSRSSDDGELGLAVDPVHLLYLVGSFLAFALVLGNTVSIDPYVLESHSFGGRHGISYS
jgi:hypothetical protein